jgi:hypothetical protein
LGFSGVLSDEYCTDGSGSDSGNSPPLDPNGKLFKEFWNTRRVVSNEKGEGSTEACHNYGSVPAYFLSSYILGVRPVGPVLKKKLLIEPRLGDLSFAEGVVVTEFGPVPVYWKKSDDGKTLSIKLSIPAGISTVVYFPKLSEKSGLIMNGSVLMKEGKPEKGVKMNGRWIIVENVSGECIGTVTR